MPETLLFRRVDELVAQGGETAEQLLQHDQIVIGEVVVLKQTDTLQLVPVNESAIVEIMFLDFEDSYRQN